MPPTGLFLWKDISLKFILKRKTGTHRLESTRGSITKTNFHKTNTSCPNHAQLTERWNINSKNWSNDRQQMTYRIWNDWSQWTPSSMSTCHNAERTNKPPNNTLMTNGETVNTSWNQNYNNSSYQQQMEKWITKTHYNRWNTFSQCSKRTGYARKSNTWKRILAMSGGMLKKSGVKIQTKKQCSQTWTQKLIILFQTFTYEMWKIRNMFLHGTNKKEQRLIQIQQCHLQIEEL